MAQFWISGTYEKSVTPLQGLTSISGGDLVRMGLVVAPESLQALRDNSPNTYEKEKKCLAGHLAQWTWIHRTMSIKMFFLDQFESRPLQMTFDVIQMCVYKTRQF